MSTYEKDLFVGCRDCGRLLPIQIAVAWMPTVACAEALQACNEFLATHGSHSIGLFHRSDTASRADRPLWDPLATITFAVSDGEHSYVVQADRRSIEDPRIYTFSPGSLQPECPKIDIDPADLRRGLDLEFYPHALRPAKLDEFESAVREVVCRVEPGDLVIAYDAADDPSVSIARMPEGTYDELLARCAAIFDPWEFRRVADFLHENRAEDGLLVLRVRRQVTTLDCQAP